MSLFPRVLLACVASLFGIMMIGIAPPTDKAVFFHAFGAFCLAIATACVTRGRVAEFFGSVIAVSVLGLGAWYIFSMFAEGPLLSGRRSEPSLLNALYFLSGFGVPSTVYVWQARFGLRRKGSQSVAAHSGRSP